VASHDAPVPGKLSGQVPVILASAIGGIGTGANVRVSETSSGHLVFVLSTPPSTPILAISMASQPDNSKQSLYVMTHHGSHLTPHQLSISMIRSTRGSHEAVVLSLKYNLQGSSAQGVGAGVWASATGGDVGIGVGFGVGPGLGNGVGALVGGFVGWGVYTNRVG